MHPKKTIIDLLLFMQPQYLPPVVASFSYAPVKLRMPRGLKLILLPLTEAVHCFRIPSVEQDFIIQANNVRQQELK